MVGACPLVTIGSPILQAGLNRVHVSRASAGTAFRRMLAAAAVRVLHAVTCTLLLLSTEASAADASAAHDPVASVTRLDSIADADGSADFC